MHKYMHGSVSMHACVCAFVEQQGEQLGWLGLRLVSYYSSFLLLILLLLLLLLLLSSPPSSSSYRVVSVLLSICLSVRPGDLNYFTK